MSGKTNETPLSLKTNVFYDVRFGLRLPKDERLSLCEVGDTQLPPMLQPLQYLSSLQSPLSQTRNAGP